MVSRAGCCYVVGRGSNYVHPNASWPLRGLAVGYHGGGLVSAEGKFSHAVCVRKPRMRTLGNPPTTGTKLLYPHPRILTSIRPWRVGYLQPSFWIQSEEREVKACRVVTSQLPGIVSRSTPPRCLLCRGRTQIKFHQTMKFQATLRLVTSTSIW